MSGLIIPHHGKTPVIADNAFIAPTAAVIGEVEIGEETGIWFGVVLRGDGSSIKIGKRTNIQDGTVVHVNSRRGDRPDMPTVIGDDVTIGHMALIHACTLQDRAFVGMQACVMDLAVVESDAMVAAGSLVTPGKVVKSGQLWSGRPAKYMRDLTPEEIDSIRHSAAGYVENAKSYR